MNTLLISGISILGLYIVSVASSSGLAVLLVEKSDDWPISLVVNPSRNIISRLNSKMGGMFDCTVCMSFWASLLVDAFLFAITGGSYFLWPLTGFAASGFVWLIVQFLNAIDGASASGSESDDSPQ